MQYRKGRKSPWVVQIRNESGLVFTRSFLHKIDALEAEAHLRKTRQRVLAGLERPKTKILFFDFAADFMKRRTQSLPQSTWSKDESRLRKVWLPRFGMRALTSLTTPDIESLLDELMSPGLPDKNGVPRAVSHATRNRHRALLHTLFQEALKSDHVGKNPVSQIQTLSEKIKSKPLMRWHGDEPDKYLVAAKELNPLFSVWAAILFWSGVRVNEATPIKWGDIDFERNAITVSRIFDVETGEIFERTKGQGAGGKRTMPLFPVLKEALLRHREMSAHGTQKDFVLAKASGQHFTYSFWSRAHQTITEKAGVTRIRIHDIRHKFAEEALKAGYSMRELQEMLGHEDSKTTEIYAHVDQDHLLEKGRRVGFGKLKVCQQEAVAG